MMIHCQPCRRRSIQGMVLGILLSVFALIALLHKESLPHSQHSFDATDARTSLSEASSVRYSVSTRNSSHSLAEISLPTVADVAHLAKAIGFTSEFDRYRVFKTKPFFTIGEDWNKLSDDRSLCFAAQTSVDRMHSLLQTMKMWTGPMSIVLFVPDVELHVAVIFIEYLRSCNENVRRQVSFHLTFPEAHPGSVSKLLPDWITDQASCAKPKEFLDLLMTARTDEMMEWRRSLEYPQNLLRNVAKHGCQTEYTFIPDIDMIPTPGLDMELETFLATKEASDCKKCAFVIPTFEIKDSVSVLPKDKTELVLLAKQKLAQQFHVKIWDINQKSSDLQRWLKIPKANKLGIGYKVQKYIFQYEPLYVARADTPIFDERFVGFGMTRNTQVYEMYVAGYDFYVLNNAFTSHWGFQTLKTRPKWRAKQQERNNARFDDFAKEVTARYGRDPYDMVPNLKKMDLKNIKVAYGLDDEKPDNKQKQDQVSHKDNKDGHQDTEAKASLAKGKPDPRIEGKIDSKVDRS